MEYRDRGYSARVLVLDDGRIVGKCHTIPVGCSPFVGRDLLAILCLYVHMYDHGIGDQRKEGYGRHMLREVEKDASSRGYKGVVSWAMDWDWNPVSFYEHMGYSRVDQEDKVVVVWKPLRSGAEAPSLLRLECTALTSGGDRVNVVVADNPWCLNYAKRTAAREAIRGIEQLVDYTEVGLPWNGRIPHLGHVGGVFLDGIAYRPYKLIGESRDLRAEIVRLHKKKQSGKVQ